MTINKRKRFVRLRGSRTHGWGTKKHRGAGNRGGRGMAGTGKRADQKKPSIIKEFGYSNYFGRHGFKRPQNLIKENRIINLSELKSDSKIINLTEMGFDKLLGKGMPDKAYDIIVNKFSNKAKEKIEKIKGTINKQIEK